MSTRIFLLLLLLTFYACTRSDRIQYEAVQSVGTVESYQQFLRNNPKSRFADEVQDKLYTLAYRKTAEINTAQAYDDYIRKYPESPHLEELIKKKEDSLISAVFKEVQAENTLQGYINFVTKYPEHDLAKKATKSILNKQIQLNVTDSGSTNKPAKLSELLLEDLAKMTPKQIAELIKNIQQKEPKAATNRIPVARSPSAQVGELTAQAPLFSPSQSGFVEEPTTVSPDKQNAPFLRKADLQETSPQIQAKAQISGTEPQIQAKAQISGTEPQIQAKAQISGTEAQISGTEPQISGTTSPEQHSDLIDDTPISFRSSNTPDKVLYGKAFVSSRAPRVIHKEFSFFIKALQKTSQYVKIKASFHNLNESEKEFFFSRINLVNSQGRRVKPVSVKGGGWKVSGSGVKSKAFGNERSEFIILFPSLNLFRNNNYKLYVTVNDKNYLIQI